MSFKDIINLMNPARIIERIQKNRMNKRIMLLCENNPQNVFDFVSSGFGEEQSVENILNALDSLIKDKKEIDINAILNGFLFNNELSMHDEDINKIVKYAIKNDLNIDINMVKDCKDFSTDHEIAKYVYDKGGIDAYSFCKMYKPDKNNIQYWVEQDLKCIEFDIANNPKVYEYVIDKSIEKIKKDMSQINTNNIENQDKKTIYNEMISYLEKSKSVIFNKREKKEGKYYFPESEMYKNIRNFVKRYEEKNNKEKITDDDLEKLNKPFKAFYERDGFFDEDFGKKIQSIYLDDATVLGVHNTDRESLEKMGNDEQFLKQFFDNGLCRLHDTKSVLYNVAIQGDLSLAELLYWIWDMRGKYNIVFQFPKSLLISKDEYGASKVIERIDGTNEKHIPPKYIVGAYDRENPNTSLINNPNFYEGHVISKEGIITK